MTVFRPFVHHPHRMGHLYGVHPICIVFKVKMVEITIRNPFWPFLLRTQEVLPSCEVAVHMSICFAHHQTFAADRAQHSVQRAAVDPVDPAALRPKVKTDSKTWRNRIASVSLSLEI